MAGHPGGTGVTNRQELSCGNGPDWWCSVVLDMDVTGLVESRWLYSSMERLGMDWGLRLAFARALSIATLEAGGKNKSIAALAVRLCTVDERFVGNRTS
jgi:hypothetical protein